MLISYVRLDHTLYSINYGILYWPEDSGCHVTALLDVDIGI